MKNFIYTSLWVAVSLMLVGCTLGQDQLSATKTINDDQLAQQVLVEFLQSLHAGEYAQAAQLYGGTYESMANHNPGIDPDNHIALLRNACTINGVQCLQVKSVDLDRQRSATEFVFKVAFLNADGTLFVLGPCCDSTDIDFPPQSMFDFTVTKGAEGQYLVQDMPPYVP